MVSRIRGQHAGAWREAGCDVVHDRGERVGLSEHCLDAVEGGIVDGLDQAFGGCLPAAGVRHRRSLRRTR
jgi:hypothetical protein